MKGFIVLAIISAFVSIPFVNGKSISNTEPSFEIKDGNCTNPILGDLVFQDHHHKLPIPFVKRDATSQWAGDQKIYCILAVSEQSESEQSTVEITEGGTNHTYVTLKMKSKKGHGFEYDIKVFGK